MSCRGGVKGKGQREWVRCTARNAPEWLTSAVDKTRLRRAGEILGRVASKLCASSCPLEKTVPTGGTEAAATQSSGKDQGDVVHCEPEDLDRTAKTRRGVESC